MSVRSRDSPARLDADLGGPSVGEHSRGMALAKATSLGSPLTAANAQRQATRRRACLNRVVRDSPAPQRGYPGMSPTLNLLLPAVPENVATARRAIGGLCEHLDIQGEAAGDIRLAVSEACTACVEHSRGAEG